MPPFGRKHDILAIKINGFLLHADSGHRLEPYPEDNGFAVADSTLNAATIVGPRPQVCRFLDEGVIVLTAAHTGTSKSGPDVKALGSGQGEHGLGQPCLQLVED